PAPVALHWRRDTGALASSIRAPKGLGPVSEAVVVLRHADIGNAAVASAGNAVDLLGGQLDALGLDKLLQLLSRLARLELLFQLA
ncbi:MAG: hypothetical protein IJ781_01620, partial [Atopobiaceae bacterium]|nr:hypothetical protein [Atopobiaceae bacterium]